MSEQDRQILGSMRGRIRTRLLVNALVDPDEAARRLPAGLRPHVASEGTVVGCCLLDIADIRPAGVPAVVGTSLRAAGHRISVEWDDDAGTTTTGVYVPLRLTDSRAAIALGGRLFPGVHRRASITLSQADEGLMWLVEPGDDPGAYPVRVAASSTGAAAMPACEPIGGTCLSAEIGLSPGHRGTLEAARMAPRHRQAERVDVIELDAAFLTSFSTAVPGPSYLMRDVEVTWTRARVPRLLRVQALA